MEVNKDGLLFSYLDSIETPDLFSNYKTKKIPSLNEYAENYLANIDKPKFFNDINNNSCENINDNNSSVKGLSNDISNNETNIQTNQISKINDKLIMKNYDIYDNYDEINDMENHFSDKLKTRNSLTIEHLKKNFYNQTKKSKTSSKINNINFVKNDDNKSLNSQKNIHMKKKKKLSSKLYKKISPPNSSSYNSPLFSAFRNTNSKNTFTSKYFQYNNNNYNAENSNFSKSKSFLSEKGSQDNNNIKYLKINKKSSSSYLTKNFLTNYIYSDRDRFNKNIKKMGKLNKNRLRMNFSESHTDENLIPWNSISKRYYNKSYSKSIEEYWRGKEIKKQIKMQKIRKENMYKEICEIREKPKIDENSRKIAEKLGYNSSLNVFDRLTNLARNHLIFNERKLNLKSSNNDYKIQLYKEINYQNYLNRSQKGLELDKNYKSLKQIENINKIFIDKINLEKEKKKKKNLINLNKYINKKENQNNKDISKDYNISSLNNTKNKYKDCLKNDIELQSISLERSTNNVNKIVRPTIMHKKIQLRKKYRKNGVQNNLIINQKSNDIIGKKSNYNIKDNSSFINKSINLNKMKNKMIISNYNSKKNIDNYNFTNSSNKEVIYSYKSQRKNLTIKKFPNYSQQNINNISDISKKKEKICNLNTNNISNRTNYNSKVSSGYKNEKLNTNLNKFNTINILNNKKKKCIINPLKKKHINKTQLMNNEKISKNKFIKNNYNNSILINLGKNNNSINNDNIYNTSKYFKLPSKNEFNEIKDINIIQTDYSFNKNEFMNKHSKSIYDNRNIIKNGDNKNKKYMVTIGRNDNYNSMLESYINFPSYMNEDQEQTNNITRRRLELLKLLEFSSNIGTNYNNC